MNTDFFVINELDFSLGAVNVQESENLSALKNHYIRQVRENDFGVDKIYFSGEFPSVYFKKVADFESPSQAEILATHQKIWNQGKVPFLYVESPFEVRVYNCYEKPVNVKQEDRTIQDLELYQTVLSDLSELKQVFDKISIETGRFWKEEKYAEKVSNDSRIEKELIKNLQQTRRELRKSGLSVSTIHNLLLRSLFILYLEDREATDPAFYQKITKQKGVTSYFEILDNKQATYFLFEELEDKFNGNLSPITEEEATQVSEFHLSKIKECFWAEIRENGQMKLFDWRLFDFQIIPIQLLSEIYEEFLGEADPEGKAKTGAFYTPHPLAEFVLNQMLPYPNIHDTKHDIKILDPTCGSGIFLVESLNRLLDRWEMANPEKQLSFGVICKIVKKNIFGIEINEEAIKVAAFSIYLAMLNRLDPKKLWQNKRFPYLIYNPEETDPTKQGKNLFRMSSLGSGPFEEVDFDMVVGNPPFKRGGLKKEEKDYLNKKGYAQELVLAFLDRVTTLAPNAKYGLVCGSKPLLFNNGKPYQDFRKFLFNENYVDKVYNFSILRKGAKKEGGRNLFASAVSPISIVFYSKQIPANPSEKLMYCAPKTAIKNRIIDGIAIDKTDVSYLPRVECQKPDSKIWKVAMWGTERDFQLVQTMWQNANLKDHLNQNNWKIGRGFQLAPPNIKTDTEIKNVPFLDARKVDRYYTNKSSTIQIENTEFRRIGTTEVYKSPHLLIKRSQKNKEFCCSYLDFDCSFKDIMYGIYSNGEQDDLKLLLAYLNSSLAFYSMFLASASWGVEREEVKSNEILNLPSSCFDLGDIYSEKIIYLVDQIIKIKKSNLLNEAQLICELEQKIETILWDALSLSDTERILIEDLLNYSLDAFQNKQKSIAYRPCQLDDTKTYAKYLNKTINEFLDYDDELGAWSIVFELSHRIPLNVTVLYLNNQKAADTVVGLPEQEIGQILKAMEQHTYNEFAESIYFRRFFHYYDDDKVYIIKPNEKRFWSRSMAINDADELIVEMLNQMK